MIRPMTAEDYKFYEKKLMLFSLSFVLICHGFFLFYKKIIVEKSELYAELFSAHSQVQTVVKIVVPSKEQILPEKSMQKVVTPKASEPKKVLKKEIQKIAKLAKTENVALGQQNEMTRYKEDIRELVMANRYYPRSAQRLGHTGRVVVSILVSKEGQVLTKKVDSHSPYDSLNSAALKTIEKVGVFPPIPEILKVSQLDLEVPIVFAID